MALTEREEGIKLWRRERECEKGAGRRKAAEYNVEIKLERFEGTREMGSERYARKITKEK